MISNQPPKKMIKEIDIFKPESEIEEKQILQILPLNGCSCNRTSEILTNFNPKGCFRTQQWLNNSKIDTSNFGRNYSRYRMYLNFKNSEVKLMQIIEDIELDLERTFIDTEYFNRAENK